MVNAIILIGYRATGKSSVGKRLAERLGMLFVDMDRELEEEQGESIATMVAAQGWPCFRGLEKALLAKLIQRRGLVISTGGGAILHQDLWPKVKESGLVVWLTANRETICQRLMADERTVSQRPSLTATSDTCAEIAAVLTEREPLYRAGCHLAVDTATLGVDEIVDLIADRARGLTAAND
jgi:shikimate kinase